MDNKITLPSGATALLRDPKTLKVKDRKRIVKAADNAEGGDLSKAMALVDEMIATLVVEWSFDLIIPSVKIASLDELEPADYDTLTAEARKAQSFLYPSLTDSDEAAKDADSPFDNSNDSVG